MNQTLPEGLQWVVYGGGAGVITYLLIEALKKWQAFKVKWDLFPAELKRYISFAGAIGLGSAAFGLQTWFGYEAPPGDLTAWVERFFAIAISQIIHARIKQLRANRQ